MSYPSLENANPLGWSLTTRPLMFGAFSKDKSTCPFVMYGKISRLSQKTKMPKARTQAAKALCLKHLVKRTSSGK